jgi:hypothetical protein
LVGKPEGKNHWGDQDVDGSIILRWIFQTEWAEGNGKAMHQTDCSASFNKPYLKLALR